MGRRFEPDRAHFYEIPRDAKSAFSSVTCSSSPSKIAIGVPTAKEGLLYLEEVNKPNVYLHLDTYHMNIEEDGMVDGVLAAGDRLGYVHVGESHRGYLGTGNVDFDSFFGALKKINYQGPVTFESFSSAVVDPALSNALRIWRNLWTDSHDLADKAIQFMKKRYA